MPTFSTKSAEKLLTCHHDLQRLFTEVVKSVDCTILCGHRDKDAQDEAYETGHSKEQWPHSRHNSMPSEAVDVALYPIDWNDLDRFRAFAAVVKECAARLGIAIQWGGDFETFKDFPHWQLPRA